MTEQNRTLEVFRNSNFLRRLPRHVYELEDLRENLIEGQFFAVEHNPFKITNWTYYLVNKVLDTRVGRGIRDHLVRWREYGSAFDRWIDATDIRQLGRRR